MKAAEHEGAMQLYPSLAGVFWKGLFHHFPILENLSDREQGQCPLLSLALV